MKRLYYILALSGALLMTDAAAYAQGASVRRQPNNNQQQTQQRQQQATPTRQTTTPAATAAPATQQRQPQVQTQSSTQQQARTPQATRGSRNQQEAANTGLPDLTIRAQDMNERMTQQIGNARWMRVIYREIDLTKEENAPLYYPTRPINGNMNLFTTIFQLMSEGKLTAYEYHDGY